MSTAEIANPIDSNAQSAQDVQNMLAELKGGGQPGAATDSSAPNNDEVAQASNNEESIDQSKSNDLAEKSGVDDPENKKNGESAEGKKGEDVASEHGEGSQGRRPHHEGYRGRGGGRGRGDFKSYKQNIKSDLIAQEETDDPVQIRKQVEFYFSDSNLPMDRFLLSQVGGSKNFSVDLKIIHSFKRMRHFQPFSAIVAALKESTFLELTDDDTKVKRKKPLPETIDPEKMDPDSIKVFEDRAMPRSVYVKGFGEEDSKTQFDIEAFFAPYGPYNAIRLRRANDKVFKGSVFVEFDSEETQKKFLDLDPKPQYKGKALQIMSKKEYCEKKVDDIKSGKTKPNGQSYRGRGGHQNKRKRDDEDDRDWRERREDDQKNGFRDSRRGGRGGRGGRVRDSRREQGTEIRKDARGVPIVESTEKSTKDDSTAQAKREAATADALAKAKAMVQAENAKNAKPDVERKQDNDDVDEAAEKKTETEVRTEDPSAPIDGAAEKPESSSSKKRGRDETGDENSQPEAKRVDSKVEGEDGQEKTDS